MNASIISIIVPVFNAECTVARCIDSVLAQTDSAWELILVNDGSRDRSSSICKEYADKDTRIRVLDKENGGPSSARNLGLRNIKGEWVLFVDSDDYISQDTLNHFRRMISVGSDLIVPDTIIEDGKGNITPLAYQECVLTIDSFHRLFTEFHLDHRTSIGGKCFRYSIISNHGLFFDEQMHHAEDLVFIYTFLAYCSVVSFTGTADYHYVFSNPGSLTQVFNTFQTEYYGYQQISSAVSFVLSKRMIADQTAVNNLSWPVVNSMSRSLNALYDTEKNLTAKQRRERIAWLDLDYYMQHQPETNDKKVLFLNFILLKKRWVRLYDYLRVLKKILLR